MTETAGNDVIRIGAMALKVELGRQFNAKPMPGPDPTNWSATGGAINLEELFRVALQAVDDAGYVLVPKEGR